jgi:hypothetical protein
VTSPTIYGGSNNGDDLTLESTSGTKSGSVINFGASAAAGLIDRNINTWTIGDGAATKPTNTTAASTGRHWVINDDPQLVVYNSKAQGANNVSLLKLGCNTAATSAATQSYVAVKANLDSASAYGASMKLVVTNGSNAEVTGIDISSAGAVTIGASSFTGQHTIYGTVSLYQGDLDSTAMDLRGSGAEAMVRVRGGGSNSSNGLELTFIGSDTDSSRRVEIGDIDTTIASFKGNGTVYNYANSTAWNTTSDSRVKTNIREISGGLDKILRLHPVHFEYIHKPGKTKTSFIAQEFEQVLPGHIVESSCPNEIAEVLPELKGELIKGLDCDLHPYLVKAIQELKAENDQLKARIEALEKNK